DLVRARHPHGVAERLLRPFPSTPLEIRPGEGRLRRKEHLLASMGPGPDDAEIGTVARHQRVEQDAELRRGVANEGRTPPAMPSRPRLRPPLARREQGVLKFLIVVEVVSLKEEPDHDARLERQGIPREHDDFLRGPIAGDAEVGYGPTEASLQES